MTKTLGNPKIEPLIFLISPLPPTYSHLVTENTVLISHGKEQTRSIFIYPLCGCEILKCFLRYS